jgi:sulfur relay (sulfurtransferase) DsrF/TusC family protein
MLPRVLFIITSNPRRSGKPAEAIRIAAGVSAWKKTEVSVYFRDEAILALSEDTADFVNEDNITRYLPMLTENKCPVYVQENNRSLGDLGESPVTSEQLTDADLAKLAAKQNYVLRF